MTALVALMERPAIKIVELQAIELFERATSRTVGDLASMEATFGMNES
jgi:hypothetical protein